MEVAHRAAISYVLKMAYAEYKKNKQNSFLQLKVWGQGGDLNFLRTSTLECICRNMENDLFFSLIEKRPYMPKLLRSQRRVPCVLCMLWQQGKWALKQTLSSLLKMKHRMGLTPAWANVIQTEAVR